MFRIVCDPSSGSIELYLNEIRRGSLMFVVCLVGVWHVILNCNMKMDVKLYDMVQFNIHLHITAQNYAAKQRPSTGQTSVNHHKFQTSTGLYSLMMDRIRFETCWSDFQIYVF